MVRLRSLYLLGLGLLWVAKVVFALWDIAGRDTVLLFPLVVLLGSLVFAVVFVRSVRYKKRGGPRVTNANFELLCKVLGAEVLVDTVCFFFVAFGTLAGLAALVGMSVDLTMLILLVGAKQPSRTRTS